VLSDGAASYTPSISERRGTATTFLHSGLKNADAQTSTSGSVSGTRVYDAFGAELSSTGSWQGAFGYAGGFGYQEDANGFKLLGHRYYDPSTGRFLTRDPIKDGRNWYAYCESSPLFDADPTGLFMFSAGGFARGVGKGLLSLAVGVVVVTALVLIAPAALTAAILVGAAALAGWALGQGIYESFSGKAWAWSGDGAELNDDERSEVIGETVVGLTAFGLGAKLGARNRKLTIEKWKYPKSGGVGIQLMNDGLKTGWRLDCHPWNNQKSAIEALHYHRPPNRGRPNKDSRLHRPWDGGW